MEIKNTLKKPYTEDERLDFIIENNHNKGYEIKETEEALEAWGYTEEELLENAKTAKKQEASKKAYEYIDNGALFEFEPGKHIEANDGNISKLGLVAVELVLNQDTESTIEWCTSEDEVVNLNAEQLQVVVQGLKAEQTRVWVELFPSFLADIEQAETLEAVNAIEIDYNKKLQVLKAAAAPEVQTEAKTSKIIVRTPEIISVHSGGSN